MDLMQFTKFILLQYANEKGIYPRDNADLLGWLIGRLKNTTEADSEIKNLIEYLRSYMENAPQYQDWNWSIDEEE